MDCQITKNYFNEKAKMTDSCASCIGCIINEAAEGKGLGCSEFEMTYPQEAIELVQKWGEGPPPLTYLRDFNNQFPRYDYKDNLWEDYCVKKFYGQNVVSGDCRLRNCEECWKSPIPQSILNVLKEARENEKV